MKDWYLTDVTELLKEQERFLETVNKPLQGPKSAFYPKPTIPTPQHTKNAKFHPHKTKSG